MKKILALAMSLLLLLTVTACGPTTNDIEVVKATAAEVCAQYNASTDKIVDGEISATVENATTVNVEHTVIQIIDASTEHLVEQADAAIMDLFVNALNEQDLPEGHTVNINTTYDYME